ncbi:transposase [Pseudoduganella namucuonensis]|uniref:Putative transposase n=1 Tax=Pseudoduganella namucuonensis TaxID=1035707 RepID=A0A1I7KZD5_9BURK|nr:transposase [Pseudoduganella namucuonensis]SFV02811.1 putative transposase [Pseudoduganella namucuonensis]
MPRRPRLILPRTPLHLIQRGNNRQPCFHSDSDYLVYLEWLKEHADGTGCAVHSYALMSNHVHLLISFDDEAAPGALMKAQGQRYTQYFNWRYGRSGSLWDGRYKSCVVQEEGYLLECQRYIEKNPVRAGMVDFPAQYRWSSYRCNAEGKADALVRPHAVYQRLGKDARERQQAYRDLFINVDERLLEQIRAALYTEQILGNAAFIADVAHRLRLK